MGPEKIKLIEKLMTLFRGSAKAHGVYTEIVDQDPLKKKVKGRCVTVPQAPTLKKWINHVEGTVGLGIIPINEENMCYWGVLDIDGEVDHIKLLRGIQALDLPLVVSYSKSKSAHCFLFLEQAVSAESIRSILEEMASKLGVAGCEIFPKQNTLNREKGDLGNWLNMPYYNNTRKGIVIRDGKIVELELEEYLGIAFEKRLSPELWKKLISSTQKRIDDLEDVLKGAPPCIQYILKTQGIAEGNRNKLMYNLGIFCKRAYPEDVWADKMKEIHDKFAENPLSIKELNSIISSISGKDYRYQCKDGMLKQFCNSSICVEREHGIDFSPEISSLKHATRILTTPHIYAVEVELESERPSKVYVTSEQLFRQDLFRRECSEQICKTFIPMSPKQWNEISTNLINNAINQEPPFDMVEESSLYFALMDYLSNKVQTDISVLSTEEGVFHNVEEQKVYFKLSGFRSFVIRRGLYGKDLTSWKLGNKLNSLMIPTDDVDFTTGTSKKRRVVINNETIKIKGKSTYVRTIDASEVTISIGVREEIEGVI